ISDTARLQQLRLSVLLTQQFAYFLDESPDPFTSLKRFDELSEKITQMPQEDEWLRVLARPQSMNDLARVLGASDYLWDDFIRVHPHALLPVFRRRLEGQALSPPARSMPRRLEDAMAGAKRFDEQR